MHKYSYLLLGLVGGIALGFLLGRAYGIRTGLQIAKTNLTSQMGERIEVVVAPEEIPAGTILQYKHLAKMSDYAALARNAVLPKEAKALIGRKTRVVIKERQPVFWSDIEGGDIKSNQPPPKVLPPTGP